MVKFVQKLVFITSSMLLTACVTQNFDKDTPVIEQNSSNKELAVGRVALGLGYLKMGNTTQSKFNLEKAKKFDPNLMEVYTAFAHYYETVDEPELAVKSFEKALSIKSNDANTLNNYGVFLCRQEKYIAAEKQFLKAIAIPSYLLVSKSYENLASCQLKAGDFEKAERYLSKAITHSPNSSSALYQMIQLEYAMGNYKKARRYTQKFEKVTRRFKPDSLALAVKVYQQLGNQKTAQNYGSMLVSMYPESWEAKQYILNGLERTAADDLAEKYQEVRANDKSKKAKKRVIVLSPHKNPTTQVQQQKKVDPQVALAKESSKSENKVSPTSEFIDGSTSSTVVEMNTTSTDLHSLQVSPIAKAVFISEVVDENKQIKTDITKESIDETNTGNESSAQESAITESFDDEISESSIQDATVSVGETVAAGTVTNPANSDELLAEGSSTSDAAKPVSDTAQDPIEVLSSEQSVDQKLIEVADETVAKAEINEDSASLNTESTLDYGSLPEETLVPRVFHIVVKGDNLYGISVKYNTQMKALLRFNALDESSKIHIGDKIFVTENLVEENLDE